MTGMMKIFILPFVLQRESKKVAIGI